MKHIIKDLDKLLELMDDEYEATKYRAIKYRMDFGPGQVVLVTLGVN